MEFYWSPFLVESNSDNPKIHSIQTRIIDAESIAAHAENWRNADYLVFNTYIWWMNTLNMKLKYVRANRLPNISMIMPCRAVLCIQRSK